MKKQLSRHLCFAIIFFIIVSSLPIAGAAHSSVATSHSSNLSNQIQEVTFLRTAHEKHYRLPNGTYQAISYADPVHELSNTGKWVTIDNRLEEHVSTKNAVFSTTDKRATFPSTYDSSGLLLTLQKNNHKISMSFYSRDLSTTKNTTHIPAKIITTTSNPNRTTFDTIQEAASAISTSSVTYSEILDKVDIEYIVDGITVKENIIVKAPREDYTFSFLLELTNLFPKVESDGSIGIYETNSNTIKYIIPPPYMYDSNYASSFDVKYSLSKVSDGYVLDITANKDWINNEQTKFPVTIDPTFTYATEQAEDTYIDSDNPYSTFQNSSLLWVRSNRISYIRTPDLNIPNGATLISASLQAYYFYLDHITTGSVDVGCYQILNNWSDDVITWTSSTVHLNHGLSTNRLDCETAYVGNAIPSNPKRLIFNITNAATNWVNGSPNYGIALKYEAGPNLSVLFKSYESSSSYKPRIVYEYYYEESPTYNITCYYDSSFNNHEGLIDNALSDLLHVYQNQLATQISINSITPFDIMDLCTTNGLSQDCVCTEYINGEAIQHAHRNTAYITNYLNNLRTSENEIVIYFSDWSNKYWNAAGPLTNISGLVTPGCPVALILDIIPPITETSTFDAYLSFTLIHEFAHIFNFLDNYEGNGHDSPGPQCVMEDLDFQYSDIIAFHNSYLSHGIGYCSACQASLFYKVKGELPGGDLP